MATIGACLWFDRQAEEAVAFYTAVFPRSRVVGTVRYPDAGQEIHGGAAGSVLTIDFEIDGFLFTALNGGPHFRMNPSISYFVHCDTVEDVDRLWANLIEGGTALMPLDTYPFSPRYGWLQDRFGVSWQLILAEGEVRQRVVPSLLFVGAVCGKAEEAMHYYAGIFRNAAVGDIARYEADAQFDTPGTVMYGEFQLEGGLFTAMDSGMDHQFGFNEGVSLVVDARDQAEIDYYWDKLSADPAAEQCGWLKDRYGVSWQVASNAEINRLMSDTSRANRVMVAMLEMKKIDMESLRRA